MNLTPKKASRRETAINAYWRLYLDQLSAARAADAQEYRDKCKADGTQPMPPGAHRNKFLKEKLAAESDEVKQSVEDARREANADVEDLVAKIIEATTEEDRLVAVKEFQE